MNNNENQRKLEEEALLTIKEQLGRPIAYNRVFAHIGGGVSAALMLSQAWYWTQTETVRKRGGWFYKSAKQWEEETGLTRREQETARRKLKGQGLLEEQLRGIPATLNFRINQERLIELLKLESVQTSLDKSVTTKQKSASSLDETSLRLTKAPDKQDQSSHSITENTQEITKQRIYSESTSNNNKEPLSASPSAPKVFEDSSFSPLENAAEAEFDTELSRPPITEQAPTVHKSYKPADTDYASQVFNDWREVMEYPGAVFNKKYCTAVASRLKEGYSVSDLKLAIRGVLYSEWHMGKNEAKMVYDDLELICRDGPKVEKFKKLALTKDVHSETPMTKSKFVERDVKNAISTKEEDIYPFTAKKRI